uniref:NADH-ubiquinone oxidoreductase chain 6 n=1 Tax=Curculionoidea sp. 29 KM-2017 TaxID=2219413 RepID=A0A346RIE1_9CUCU|nr:NADH dehydrogenase subunit 6 [Curculionoidea sp. 29 KM-2017]
MLCITKMILILSSLFILSKHPLSFGIILLLQTINVALIINTMTINFWFSYITILVMVGGMLILFLYMTSIASNEKFSLNMKSIIIMIMIFIPIKFNYFNLNLNNILINKKIEFMLTKFYYFPLNLLLMLIIIYLLITMIAIVKICKTWKGPLRQLF